MCMGVGPRLGVLYAAYAKLCGKKLQPYFMAGNHMISFAIVSFDTVPLDIT